MTGCLVFKVKCKMFFKSPSPEQLGSAACNFECSIALTSYTKFIKILAPGPSLGGPGFELLKYIGKY